MTLDTPPLFVTSLLYISTVHLILCVLSPLIYGFDIPCFFLLVEMQFYNLLENFSLLNILIFKTISLCG